MSMPLLHAGLPTRRQRLRQRQKRRALTAIVMGVVVVSGALLLKWATAG